MSTLLEQHRQTDFQYYPDHYVIGIVDSREDADSTVADLLAAGFGDDKVSAWYGNKGAEAIDPEGTQHGVLENLWRKIQHSTSDAKMLKMYADASQDGRACVGARADNDDEKHRASEIIGRHGGHSIIYCDTLKMESLDF